MRHLFTKAALAVTWLMLLPLSASAAIISFSTTHLGGSRWTYEYQVTAEAADPAISEFTVFFDPARYANLAVEASPPDWDSLVIQPDAGLPADGYFDSLALSAGIPPSSPLGGFSVSFDFLGTGGPGAQRFEVIDPASFEVLLAGMTTPDAPPTGVPEPGTLALSLTALALLRVRRRGMRL